MRATQDVLKTKKKKGTESFRFELERKARNLDKRLLKSGFQVVS